MFPATTVQAIAFDLAGSDSSFPSLFFFYIDVLALQKSGFWSCPSTAQMSAVLFEKHKKTLKTGYPFYPISSVNPVSPNFLQ